MDTSIQAMMHMDQAISHQQAVEWDRQRVPIVQQAPRRLTLTQLLQNKGEKIVKITQPDDGLKVSGNVETVVESAYIPWGERVSLKGHPVITTRGKVNLAKGDYSLTFSLSGMRYKDTSGYAVNDFMATLAASGMIGKRVGVEVGTNLIKITNLKLNDLHTIIEAYALCFVNPTDRLEISGLLVRDIIARLWRGESTIKYNVLGESPSLSFGFTVGSELSGPGRFRPYARADGTIEYPIGGKSPFSVGFKSGVTQTTNRRHIFHGGAFVKYSF